MAPKGATWPTLENPALELMKSKKKKVLGGLNLLLLLLIIVFFLKNIVGWSHSFNFFLRDLKATWETLIHLAF